MRKWRIRWRCQVRWHWRECPKSNIKDRNAKGAVIYHQTGNRHCWRLSSQMRVRCVRGERELKVYQGTTASRETPMTLQASHKSQVLQPHLKSQPLCVNDSKCVYESQIWWPPLFHAQTTIVYLSLQQVRLETGSKCCFQPPSSINDAYIVARSLSDNGPDFT